MKKFMKAIAFVTVMCMALSTVAFAANTANNGVDDATIGTDKKVTINVTGAGAEAQVALVLVAGEVDETSAIAESDIEYIDQKTANASGDVTFGPITTKNEVEEVSVFVGYEGAKKNYVGTVNLTQPITEVTVTKVSSKILQGTEDLKGAQQIGAGVAIELNVKAPENVAATKMIWAIRYTDAEGNRKVKYSDPINNINDVSLGSVVTGSVTLGFAFLNGFDGVDPELEDIASVTITGVDVILLFEGTVDGKAYSAEILTDTTGEDAAKKAK